MRTDRRVFWSAFAIAERGWRDGANAGGSCSPASGTPPSENAQVPPVVTGALRMFRVPPVASPKRSPKSTKSDTFVPSIAFGPTVQLAGRMLTKISKFAPRSRSYVGKLGSGT